MLAYLCLCPLLLGTACPTEGTGSCFLSSLSPPPRSSPPPLSPATPPSPSRSHSPSRSPIASSRPPSRPPVPARSSTVVEFSFTVGAMLDALNVTDLRASIATFFQVPTAAVALTLQAASVRALVVITHTAADQTVSLLQAQGTAAIVASIVTSGNLTTLSAAFATDVIAILPASIHPLAPPAAPPRAPHPAPAHEDALDFAAILASSAAGVMLLVVMLWTAWCVRRGDDAKRSSRDSNSWGEKSFSSARNSEFYFDGITLEGSVPSTQWQHAGRHPVHALQMRKFPSAPSNLMSTKV